ncbi:MAG: ABC transporter permease [Acidobacteria bacterium]|nr:ABC transporter permease [Acidobacteriota bacterium]
MSPYLWRRSPGLAAVAVLTLALGIGASATLFGVAKAVLLAPLPYRDADRLVLVRAEQDFDGARDPVRVLFQSDAVAAWPAGGPAIARVAFVAENVGALAGGAGSSLVDTAIVSGPFFDTIGGEMVLGRPLTVADDSSPAVVISARLWQQRFAKSPDALGKALIISGQPFTIVGVAASSFQLPAAATDVWMPAGIVRQRLPSCCGFTPIARLHDSASLAAARDEVTAVATRLAAAMPRALGGVRVQVISLHEAVSGATRPAIRLLSAAVALLLLIACANVANLLLASQASRAHETAVKRALGASRARLVAGALAEAAWLGGVGGALGTVLAVVGVRLIRAFPPADVPRIEAVAIDGGVLAFAIAVSVVVTLVAGIGPALQSGDVQPSLAGHQPRVAGSRRTRAVMRGVIVGQLASSIVLVTASGLLARSLSALLHSDMGVDPTGEATASLNFAMDRTLTDQQQVDLVARVIARVSAMPDVAAAGVGAARPPDASRMRLTLRRDGEDERASYQAAGVPATPGYFRALGLRLERGRFFDDTDVRQAAPVVVLAADTARRLFGDEDPIGRTIGLPVLRDGRSGSEAMTVVGITSNVKYSGLDRAADDVVYRPFAQQPWRSIFLVVRTSTDAGVLAARLSAEVAAVDDAITIGEVATMDDVLSKVTAQPRLRSRLVGAFATMAVIITAVGVFGVIAYSVSQRRNELGVRMALGADARRIRRMVLREGLVLGLVGSALGLGLAWGVTRLMADLLFATAPTDPMSFAVAAGGGLLVALAASYWPAAYAASIDPQRVLRAD